MIDATSGNPAADCAPSDGASARTPAPLLVAYANVEGGVTVLPAQRETASRMAVTAVARCRADPAARITRRLHQRIELELPRQHRRDRVRPATARQPRPRRLDNQPPPQLTDNTHDRPRPAGGSLARRQTGTHNSTGRTALHRREHRRPDDNGRHPNTGRDRRTDELDPATTRDQPAPPHQDVPLPASDAQPGRTTGGPARAVAARQRTCRTARPIS